MTQMILDERADEIVTVVVTRLQPQPQRLAAGLAGLGEPFRMQRVVEETVGDALVDEDLAGETAALLDQRAGVVLLPRVAILAEILRKRLLPPAHARRRDDRRERR